MRPGNVTLPVLAKGGLTHDTHHPTCDARGLVEKYQEQRTDRKIEWFSRGVHRVGGVAKEIGTHQNVNVQRGEHAWGAFACQQLETFSSKRLGDK